MHTMVSLSIIIIANVTLIVRVLWQKRNQSRDRQRKWKLATYLMAIAIFFVITWIPFAINSLIYMYTSSSVSMNLQMKYFFFLPCLLEMILPIISMFFLPDFKEKRFLDFDKPLLSRKIWIIKHRQLSNVKYSIRLWNMNITRKHFFFPYCTCPYCFRERKSYKKLNSV